MGSGHGSELTADKVTLTAGVKLLRLESGTVLTLGSDPDTDRTLPCFIGGSSMGEIMPKF